MSPRDRAECRVVVCRGCCCGTHTKHLGTDHAGQLATLQTIPVDVAVVTVSGCLGNCDHGNTIVVIPSPAGRAGGGHVVWLGYMLTETATAAVHEWVRAGGPGIAPMPETLSSHQVLPPRRAALTSAHASEPR